MLSGAVSAVGMFPVSDTTAHIKSSKVEVAGTGSTSILVSVLSVSISTVYGNED